MFAHLKKFPLSVTVVIIEEIGAVRYDFEGGLPPRPIPTLYGLILFSGFIQDDFQMIFCQYQHNLHISL